MNEAYICSDCHQTYPVKDMPWKCKCGGVLDLLKEKVAFQHTSVHHQLPTMWRYVDALPFSKAADTWKQVTMGEGNTPLISLEPNAPNTYMKVDYMMPTLSFKDRGAAVLIAKAKELKVESVIADSSGNAGTAIAAYAQRAGIACDIFLSSSTSPKKVAQIKAHGARIREVSGTREDVAAAAQQAVHDEGKFYASHVYNPYFYEGTKTYAYEIWEQLNGAPDTLIVPVGNGTLLLGAYYGFNELKENGLIEKVPKIVAVQAKNCSPIHQAFNRGEKAATPISGQPTLAEGIAIAAPARSKQILSAIRDTGGDVISVSEQDIQKARTLLAEKGFYVEPTTAANYAGYLRYDCESAEKVVIPLCGAGIKVT
ncbi:threonine synthase [Bacillus sp. 1780r2a1]|nr:threonine synthase [Bacillus sp. 1780r2a1]